MLSLGIDVGATKAHAIVLDENNTVIAEDASFTRRGEEGVKSVVMAISRAAAGKLGIELTDFDSVGIGIPGVVNRKTGEITRAVNLMIDRMPLKDMISHEFSVPVRFDNDVKATTVAAGMMLGSDSVTYINFGTGVASGTITDGRLLRGVENAAGEIGHMVLDPNGEPCRCGQRGCVETIVGGAYLAPRMDSLDLDWTRLDKDESPAGKAAYDQSVRVLSRVVAFVALAYASQNIVIGGGVIQAAPWALGAIRNFLDARSKVASFPPYEEIAEHIKQLDNDMQAAAIGAALIGRERVEG